MALGLEETDGQRFFCIRLPLVIEAELSGKALAETTHQGSRSRANVIDENFARIGSIDANPVAAGSHGRQFPFGKGAHQAQIEGGSILCFQLQLQRSLSPSQTRVGVSVDNPW